MRLSIVLAVHGEGGRLADVLARLDAQREPGVELLLVAAARSSDAVHARAALRGRPDARVVIAAARALVPALWAAGIEASAGARVALTVSHMLPGSSWVAALLAADLSGRAGAGGPIGQGPAEDARSWAMYLQRYAPFAPSLGAQGPCPQIAGDNAVYDRGALEGHRASWADGFWEIEVHRAFEAAGLGLAMDPALLVEHRNGYSASQFVHQRLRHGRRFGTERAAGMTLARRLAYAALAPGIPVLFGRKILSGALRPSHDRSRVAAATPWLALFVLAWSAGEAVGAQAALVRSAAAAVSHAR